MAKYWIIVRQDAHNPSSLCVHHGDCGSPICPGFQNPIHDFIYTSEPTGAWRTYVLKPTYDYIWHIVEVEHDE